MRSKLLKKLIFALPLLAFSATAFAGYQVTSLPGDGSAAEVVAANPQDTATFIVVAEIGGNAGAVTVGLVVNQNAATASFPDDFTLSFPATCPRVGGSGSITFSATSTGATTYDLDLGGFNAGGGGAVGGSAEFHCPVTINAVDDAIDEDTESLNLAIIGDPSIVKSPLFQNYTIGDNDTAALVATDTSWDGSSPITLGQKITTESGGTATFFVELATQPLSSVTVDLASSDPTEAKISSGGAPANNLELTFTTANWNTGQQVTITGQDDADVDGNIAYTVTIATTDETDNKYDNLSTGPVNGINEDNDIPGQLRFTQSSQTGSEGDVMTLTVERIGGSSGEVTVQYAISNLGSTTAADYNDTTSGKPTLSFAEGVTSKNITISLVNDTLWEPAAEQFSVALSNPTGGATILTPDTQTVTINPSDPIVIAISAPDPNPVPEGDVGDPDVPVEFDVTYSGGTLASPLTISWMTVNGSATGGADFTAVGSTNINLPVNGNPVTITVNVLGDDTPESDETFSVQLSESHDLVTLAGGGVSVATIEDDDESDAGTFAITAVTPNPVMESAGLVTVTVTRTGNSVNSAATINYATSNGTAVEPGDYTETSGALVWAEDDVATFKTFTVPIEDNANGEPDETFTVTISPGTPAEPGPQEVITVPSSVVTIIGDPTVGFSPITYNVSEDGGSITVFVARANVDDDPVSVDYTTVNGTAIAGEDFVAKTGTLNWGAAETGSQSFDIAITANADVVESETFTVVLSDCSNCTIRSGEGTATVNILEGEVNPENPGTLAFSPTALLIPESSGTVSVFVTRTGGTDGDVTIKYETAPGTATSPADFTATTGTLTWLNGQGGNKLISVPIINDLEVESTESFTVRFILDGTSPTPNAGPGRPTIGASSATVSIQDNDSPPTAGAFSVLDTNVGEGAGIINVTVTRTGGSAGAVSVNFATADGTALAGSDYTATNGTLNWANLDATAKTIPIQILDDLVVEPAEAFTVTLNTATGGATIADGSATVQIFDDDGGGTFSIDDVTVNEIDQKATLTVTRANDSNKAAFVQWETQDGTAEDENGDNDYKSDDSNRSGELVWLDGDTSSTRTITIDIVPDAKEEGDEYFTVTLVSVQGDDAVISKPNGVVTIKDPVPIPTLSQWAMGLMVLLLLGIGAYSMPLRRRVTGTRN